MTVVRSAFAGNKHWRNAHAETVLPALFRFSKIIYQRERFTLPDTDFIDLDWVIKGSRKLLLLFHGLEGSSQSQYMKGFADYFSNNGFDVCSVNFRSCSGESNRLLPSYHAGVSSDIHEVIKHITLKDNYDEIFLGGFSLGGNVMLKYLGDRNFSIPKQVSAAVAYSVPIDLASSVKVIAKPGNAPYMWMFLRSLNTKLRIKMKMFPGKLDLTGIKRIKTLEEWDHQFTAPLNGFKSGSDYYEKCSSKQFLKDIQISTLLVNAKNDPFLSASCFPEAQQVNDLVCFESPDFGGHCGFSVGFPNGHYYSEERALHFFSNKESFL